VENVVVVCINSMRMLTFWTFLNKYNKNIFTIRDPRLTISGRGTLDIKILNISKSSINRLKLMLSLKRINKFIPMKW